MHATLAQLWSIIKWNSPLKRLLDAAVYLPMKMLYYFSRKPESTNYLIYEPWGLGDVMISLHVARALRKSGKIVGVACKAEFRDFLLSLNLCDYVVDVRPPWANLKNKYSLTVQSFKKSFLDTLPNDIKIDAIIDVRGDFRHLLWGFFHRIFAISNAGFSIKNIYEKPKRICQCLGVEMPSIKAKSGGGVFLFFGASDVRRRLSEKKVGEIICAFKDKGIFLTLILEPSSNKKLWEDRGVEVIMGHLPSIVEKIIDARLVISTDSSFSHISEYFGIESIVLYGFDNGSEWTPERGTCFYSNTVLPNYRRFCSDGGERPLEDLDVDFLVHLVISKL